MMALSIFKSLAENKERILDTINSLASGVLTMKQVNAIHNNLVELDAWVKILIDERTNEKYKCQEPDKDVRETLEKLLETGRKILRLLDKSYYGYDLKSDLQRVLDSIEKYLKSYGRAKSYYENHLLRSEQNTLLLSSCEAVLKDLDGRLSTEKLSNLSPSACADLMLSQFWKEKERVEALYQMVKRVEK